MRRTKRLGLAAILLVVATFMVGALHGCGGDDPSAVELANPLKSPEAERRSKGPKPEIPQGPSSDRLIVKDLIEGTGAEIRKGDTVGVHYVAGIYETGEEIESAWVPGNPLGFSYGSDTWTWGWEKGMGGVRVGGRRMLIFPTKPGDVPFNSELGDTMVYIIDVTEIERPRRPS